MSVTTQEFVLLPRASRLQRFSTLLAVIIPFLGFLFAAYSLWGWVFTWVDLASLLVMYVATGLGITIGYHRLFTHRSFQTFAPIKFILGVLGSMAVQGPVLKWVAIHRRHHQHSDEHGDPHSPHLEGTGIKALLVGFWHAHVGWMFTADHPSLSNYVRDLSADRMICWVSRLFGVWVLLGLLIPAAVCGLITGTWMGAFLGFVWGGLVRIFLVHHVTFSINSICHLWGRQTFRCGDESRNNVICGVLAMGEGWHNNHHAFPASARHGLYWWQFDFSYCVIRVFEMLRLAWRINTPSPEAIRAKMLAPSAVDPCEESPAPSEPVAAVPKLNPC